jgi:nitrite reductase/ring-hydroxylating ferredoxin subunit
MLTKKRSGLPQGLYLVNLEEGVRLLIAETQSGYVGIPWRCPHKEAMFMTSGMVDSTSETIFCQAHAITYSLISGEAVENLSMDEHDPGSLKMYKVERSGDMFVIRSFT